MTKHLTPSQLKRLKRRQDERRASRQEQFTKSCHKRRFPTELDVKIALASAQRQRRGAARAKDECRYYRCPDCGGFHLTSQRTRNRGGNGGDRPLRKDALEHDRRDLTSVKGLQAIIEQVDGTWTYTIPALNIHGESTTMEEAKESARAVVRIVAPQAQCGFTYYDGIDLERFYALQVSGRRDVAPRKDSYMEPLLSQIRSYLFRHGLRFRKYDVRYPGPPDIVLPKYRTMVFVDPCLWHDSPDCRRRSMPPAHRRQWINEHAEDRRAELRGRRLLEQDGWRILTYWECRFQDNRKKDKRMHGLLQVVLRGDGRGDNGEIKDATAR